MKDLRARMGRIPSGAGLKVRNEHKKKYPLIIIDERVSLNLMTLAAKQPVFNLQKTLDSVLCEVVHLAHKDNSKGIN